MGFLWLLLPALLLTAGLIYLITKRMDGMQIVYTGLGFLGVSGLATLLLFAVTTPVIGWIALIITFPLSVLFVIYGYLVRYINIQ
ncbi:hypothetical protein [Geomicrobium sp. JCM 19039]|uniref:hypothetical protein n=1 Tax=Geomicrobium sp. JCM 19039 TaxID=1460636 RepID=UPI00045F122E|nr:hypothetical protein [Geomicrobium sp. JCM 19039]GAK14374.1 hypothetical protein JCM19039_4289 [Geomicrobium sp. JCM 19039]